MRDQAENLRQMVQTAKNTPNSNIIKHSSAGARVITVTSGKGGVGKTNLTVNLAVALAKLGQKVLVIDADLGTANVDVVLGCSASYNLLNLLEEGFRLDDVISDGPYGIKFLSGGSGITYLADLNDNQFQRIINHITLFDKWADIILIDTGAGLSRNVLNFVIAADEVIIVTTPEPTAITDAYAMMKAYIRYQGSAPLKLVVNRVIEADEGEIVVDKLIKAAFRFLGLPVISLGLIYEDRSMIKAVKNQQPLLVSYPDAVSARCIETIAQRLLYGNTFSQPRGIKGFFSKFFDILK